MREPKGVEFPLSVPRRLIADLLHFSKRVPSIPLSRQMDVSALLGPRRAHPARPSWSVIFMKAYARVAMEHSPLRRALLEIPRQRIYEHPQTNCSLAIERELFQEFRDPGFAPAPLLEHLVTAGRLGRKTGKGFRDYT